MSDQDQYHVNHWPRGTRNRTTPGPQWVIHAPTRMCCPKATLTVLPGWAVRRMVFTVGEVWPCENCLPGGITQVAASTRPQEVNS